ncbi:MAG TPA: polysaccharide deacetylase family protein [Longimicrobiales bacterium]
MRQRVKAATERVLTASGVAALARRRHAGRALILAYHNIVPEGEAVAGDASLHLPQRRFADQLDVLGRIADVVPLTDVLAEARGAARRPRVALTFDDATQGMITAGVDELARRGLPATVFVPPAFVGGRSFWWDAIAKALDGSLADDMRTHALAKLAGRDDSVRAWAQEQRLVLREVPLHQTCAAESQLRAAAARDITFGSHTWSHPNLSALAPAELREELERPLQWLIDTIGSAVPWIAYPYGLYDEEVVVAARAAGYEAGLRVEGGWVPHPLEHPMQYEIPRLNIPAGLSLHGFELRVSGAIS